MPQEILRKRALPSVLLLALLFYFAWSLWAPASEARAFSFSLLAGIAFGVVLQRSRFCFLCNFRDLVEKRDSRGVLSILTALAVGLLLYHVIFGTWLPVPAPDRLPPTAHIGPVSPMLAVAAAIFGLGMAISGSCISAHLYRLGEGSPTAPFALIGALIGFAVGFLSWNPLFLAVISDGVPVWLPHHLGYAGTVGLSLAVLGIIAVVVALFGRPQPAATPQQATLGNLLRRLFVERWPGTIGGVAVGIISMVAYFRVAPLGVTAELGSIARTAASTTGLLPDTLFGLDGLRGCATIVKQAFLSNNGLFVLGLVGGSFASALAAGQFQPQWPTGGQMLRGLAGGALMGWAAMIGLGCTVGVLLSGIHAGALAGWVFLFFCPLGILAGFRLMRRFN